MVACCGCLQRNPDLVEVALRAYGCLVLDRGSLAATATDGIAFSKAPCGRSHV
jgi:hypothetical protein